MDTIGKARAEMERMDSLYARAEARGASPATLDQLAQATADAEAAYYRACDFWEPEPFSESAAKEDARNAWQLAP